MVGLDMSSHIGLGLIGFTIWLVGPHLTLGMMDNGCLLKPISVTVVGSLHKCPDAWGAYYFFASIAFATLVGLAIWAEQEMSFPVLIAGMVAPWLIYFIFHQVGVLAESIGEGMAK